MPIYEYKCPQCGKEIELLQGFDDPAPHCVICSGTTAQWKEREKEMDGWVEGDVTDDQLDFLVSWVSRINHQVQDQPTPDKVIMKRLISRTSFQLKGDGWEKDGYGSGGGNDDG